MMVLHKGTLEDLFLILLETTAYFYQDKKFPLHSIYCQEHRAQRGAADKDGDSHSEVPEAPLFSVTEHVRNLGQITFSVHRLSLCNTEKIVLPPFKQSAGGIKIPRLRGVKSLDDEVSALSK